MGDAETKLREAHALIDDEIIPEIIGLVLETEYDFEITDNGGVRGEDLSVTGMDFFDREGFKTSLRNILLRRKVNGKSSERKHT